MAQIPLFALKNCFNFDGNVLGQMFTCKKDMYYRFLSNEDIHWRQLLYSFNRRFLSRIAMSSGSVKSTDPRCLIADDTDFPRTGRKGGLLGLVFSHIKHESSLDYKVFFSCSLMERHKPSWTSLFRARWARSRPRLKVWTRKQRDARYSDLYSMHRTLTSCSTKPRGF